MSAQKAAPWHIGYTFADEELDCGYEVLTENGDEIACRLPKGTAALISAAPELYAKLKEAVQWDNHDDGGVPSVWLDAALSALAKAEGREV